MRRADATRFPREILNVSDVDEPSVRRIARLTE